MIIAMIARVRGVVERARILASSPGLALRAHGGSGDRVSKLGGEEARAALNVPRVPSVSEWGISSGASPEPNPHISHNH